jgi:hypothetical protein
MNSNIIKLVACLAWGGAAVSSATPATAMVATTQSGSYAACTAMFYGTTSTICYNVMNYQQLIKFNAIACGTGGCSADSFMVYTDTVYGSGRKTTTSVGFCSPNSFYWIGTCSC